ncbi:unnamed protein product [Dibothriocephalus latus]|uniref:Uncharacterized protein n=1 Tax=Dibothriocephalus latus TaxID=60516 RepID=A0A3P7NYN6_DIBLA|nr:unnamed protein product [Dibothriocephalus latus]
MRTQETALARFYGLPNLHREGTPDRPIVSLNGIPTYDLAVEAVKLLRSKYDETENSLGHAQLPLLSKFCLRTYFAFDGTIYEQVETPMGSLISGLIGEAVLQRQDSLVIQHHRPTF